MRQQARGGEGLSLLVRGERLIGLDWRRLLAREQECPKSTSRREDLRQAALQTLNDPIERDHLKRTRPRIERLLSLIAYRYHARKSRYRGTRKSTLQAVWTAVLVNLHPIAAALRAQTA
jgi:hypothetical protein